MKKLLLILVLSFATVISSFANDFKTNAPKVHPGGEPSWTVSSYGFLVFPTVFDLDGFKNFAITKTHAEIQQYITDSLSGFSSLGSSLYSSSGTVTESEAYDYAMNTYRIIQTEGVVLRPVSPRECSVNFEFILAITPANLNSTTYGYLQSGTYDQYSMNKFSTDPVLDSISLSTFMVQTPSGYEETDANSCPGGDDLPIAYRPVYDANRMNIFVTDPFSGITPNGPFMVQTSSTYEKAYPYSYPSGGLPREHRPFWGWGPSYCVAGQEFNAQTNTWFTTHRNCDDYYVFWIRVTPRNTHCDAAQYGNCPVQ